MFKKEKLGTFVPPGQDWLASCLLLMQVLVP
jgi:hypothetical protein